MLDYLSHPYLRWLRERSQDDSNGSGGLPYKPKRRALNSSSLQSDPPFPDFSPIGLAAFAVHPRNEGPDIGMRIQDPVPGFNLTESGTPNSGPPWSMKTTAPEAVDFEEWPESRPQIGQLEQPMMPLPEWLYNSPPPPLQPLSAPSDQQSAEDLASPARPNDQESPRRTTPQDARTPHDAQPGINFIMRGPDFNTENTAARGKKPLLATSPTMNTGTTATPSETFSTDPALILANAGELEAPSKYPTSPLPEDQSADARILTAPSREVTGQPLEPSTEQEIWEDIERYRRKATDFAGDVADAASYFGKRFYEDSILRGGNDLVRLAERFAENPVDTTLSVLNSFPQTRVEGEFLASFAAVFTILQNAKRGIDFEKKVIAALNDLKRMPEVSKNTSKISAEGLGNSIPDLLRKGVTEIKDSVEVDFTRQLAVQAAHAGKSRVPFNLIVSSRTRRISQSVRDAVESTGGTILRFDLATGTFTPFR